jgi:hypothetical protein
MSAKMLVVAALDEPEDEAYRSQMPKSTAAR